MDDSLSSAPTTPTTPAHRRFVLPDDIVVRLRHKDERAYRELVERSFYSLTRYAYSFVHSLDIAQDIAQETLIQVLNQGEALNPKGSLVAYMLAAVRNRALNVLRNDANAARYKDALREDVDSGSLVEISAVEAERSYGSLEDMVSVLTEKQRTAILLRFGEQLTIEQIAGILGISVLNTRKLIDRALGALRKVYKK